MVFDVRLTAGGIFCRVDNIRASSADEAIADAIDFAAREYGVGGWELHGDHPVIARG